ncbi:unnamed protein product [Soboliphyme baturini]|uniref:Late endosomal/lysosomal adaptor and MAPK and MTOR activator 1 n=1 Tax=Soboliphyme baturini TaxID=241478 RepID=A0A183J644_9BILA|nr:unnamed protein product [Soboliphyme baturini]
MTVELSFSLLPPSILASSCLCASIHRLLREPDVTMGVAKTLQRITNADSDLILFHTKQVERYISVVLPDQSRTTDSSSSLPKEDGESQPKDSNREQNCFATKNGRNTPSSLISCCDGTAPVDLSDFSGLVTSHMNIST